MKSLLKETIKRIVNEEINNYINNTELQQRLENGENPEDIFEYIDKFNRNGFRRVKLNGKWNIINPEGKLVSNTWFDECSRFGFKYAYFVINNVLYHIDIKGQIYDAEYNPIEISSI